MTPSLCYELQLCKPRNRLRKIPAIEFRRREVFASVSGLHFQIAGTERGLYAEDRKADCCVLVVICLLPVCVSEHKRAVFQRVVGCRADAAA
jgi:hypothetical protein